MSSTPFLRGNHAMSENWYIGRGDQQLGPFTVFELKELGMAGKVEPTDAVWREGMPNRIPATRVKGLLPVAAELQAAPSPTSDADAVASTDAPTKSPEQEAEERRK